MTELSVDQQNISIEKIVPKGRGTPFLKITFLMQGERKDATGPLHLV